MAYPISRQPKVSAPYAYQLGPQESFEVRSISATWDGTSAAGAFIPCVSVYAQDGSLLGRFKGDATVSVGDTSTEGTFAPFLKRAATATPSPAPSPLGTLIAWYDYSLASSILLDGSGNIQQINDLSGNSHHATQTTAARRPAQTTVNGLGAGKFASANTTCLSTGIFPSTYAQPLTYAFVVTQTAAAGGVYWPGFVAGRPGHSNFHVYEHHDSARVVMQVDGGPAIITNLVAPFTQQMFVCVFNGGASSLRLNGAAFGSTVSVTTLDGLTMGTQFDGQIVAGEIDFMDGAVCELLVYSGALSAAQIAATESYLRTKWGTP